MNKKKDLEVTFRHGDLSLFVNYTNFKLSGMTAINVDDYLSFKEEDFWEFRKQIKDKLKSNDKDENKQFVTGLRIR